MRKKLLTAALAATMVVGSVFSAFAETASSLDNTAGWANPSNAGFEALTGDFDVTYSFKIDQVGTANWNNFVIEMRTGQVDNYDFLDIRADGFAFTSGPAFGKTFDDPSTSKLVANWTIPEGHDWAAWLAACAGATVEANLVRTGDTFKYKATFSTGTVLAADFSFDGVDVPDAVELTLLGDGAKFSNITFTNNANNVSNETTVAPADGDGAATTPTSKAPDTGDATTAATMLLVVAAVGSSMVVLATKKSRVAE